MMSQKKRILLIYYKLFKAGGVAKVFINLANVLSEKGYQVDILLLMSERPHFYPLNPEVKVHNIDTFSHWAWKICEINIKYFKFIPKIRNLNAYIYHIGVFLMIKKWMKKHHQHYDTIISSWYKLSSFLALNKKVNFKTIAWEHVTYQTGGIIYRDILRRYYKNLKAIVCINSPSINYYKKYNKTYFIPNIIGEPFDKQQHIDFEKKEQTISFVGRLDMEKNVKALLEIFEETKINPHWKLQIIGDGNERKNLEEFASQKLKDRVIFYGTKTSDEIAELLKKSKIFAFTSLKEALPTVLVEAMFCGNAIISYQCNYGPADIITKKTGFLIPLHDKEYFKEKLQLLANDNEVLHQYMQHAFEESQNWKREKIIQKWEVIL